MARIRLLLATLWVGSLWTVGYIVAPTLFATLADRTLAGTIAGSIFHTEAWVSLVSGLILLLLMFLNRGANERLRKQLLGLIVAMLACTAVGYFGLQPYMAALKDAAGSAGLAAAGTSMQFAWLHGIASIIFLLQSLLGIGLILKLR